MTLASPDDNPEISLRDSLREYLEAQQAAVQHRIAELEQGRPGLLDPLEAQISFGHEIATLEARGKAMKDVTDFVLTRERTV